MRWISNRGENMPASPIRRLIPFADEAKKRGIKVFHLNIGQPDISTPDMIYDAMKKYKEKVLAYGPSQGLLRLRSTISEYLAHYGIEMSPDEIFITTGGSEAIIFSLMAIADMGDEILIPEPFYTNYNGFAAMSSLKIIPIPTRVEQGFHLPPEQEIVKRISSKTKAILVCTPNNPTGTIYTREEMETIANIAIKHNLFVLSDEVYREFVFDGRVHTSIMDIKDIKNQCAIMDSISKRFSACGARIGYIATHNRKFYETILKFGQARLCPPTLEQIGAEAGFKYMNEFMNKMVDEYKRRRDIVYEEIQSIDGAYTEKPEGAFYAVVKLPVDNAETFVKWMLTDFSLDNKTTMVAPADGFYATEGKGKDEVRIAFVLKEKALKDAMNILKEGLIMYRKLKRP